MSSTMFSLSPTDILSGRGLRSLTNNKNWLGLDLSISILTPIKLISLLKFKVKSLK